MTSKTDLARAPQNSSQSNLEEQEKDLLAGLSTFDELFERFYGHLALDDLKSLVLTGDPMALLAAVGHCLGTDTKAPDWVRCGFLGALFSYRYGVVRTLDDAFHVKRPSNWRRKRAIKNAMDFELWRYVEKYKLENPKEDSTEREVFENVAEEFNAQFEQEFPDFDKDYKITVNWKDVEAAYKRTREFMTKNPDSENLKNLS